MLQHLLPFLITDYDIRFNVMYGSVSLHLFSPQYSYLPHLLLLPSLLHKVTPLFYVRFYCYFLA